MKRDIALKWILVSLMVVLAGLMLSGCSKPPVAPVVLPPAPEAPQAINAAPIGAAVDRVADASDRVAASTGKARDANAAARATNEKLSAALARASALASAGEELQLALTEAEAFAGTLFDDLNATQAALFAAEADAAALKNEVRTLQRERIELVEQASRNAAAVQELVRYGDNMREAAETAVANEATTRTQLATATEQARVSGEKLSFWRTRALWTWGILGAVVGVWVVVKAGVV